jgi:hypothetical protein
MTDSITPPPELVQQWKHEWNTLGARHPDATDTASYVAARAAQWGADQELEACCEWVAVESIAAATELRVWRRPKPPSLKEQAYAALDTYIYGNPDHGDKQNTYNTIRRALEALPE